MHRPKLSETAHIRNGFPIRSRFEHDPRGNIRIIMPADFGPFEPPEFGALRRKMEVNAKIRAHLLQPGDILFYGRSGKRYAAVLGSDVPDDVAAAGNLLVISAMDQHLSMPEYLNWYLNSEMAEKYFTAAASGSNMPMVSKAALSDLPVHLPDIKIQKEIVEAWYLWMREERLEKRKFEIRSKIVKNALNSIAAGRLPECTGTDSDF